MAVARRNPECPHALGALDLVGGERDQVCTQGFDIDGHPCRGLYSVEVHARARSGADALDEVSHWLDRADLVVGELQADQDRLVGQRRCEVVGIDLAVTVHGQLPHLEAVLLKQQTGFQHGLVLDGGRDDAVPLGLAGPGRTLDGQVDGLGAAAGEDDGSRLGSDGSRQSFVCFVEGPASATAGTVGRGWVRLLPAKMRQHLLQHLRA